MCVGVHEVPPNRPILVSGGFLVDFCWSRFQFCGERVNINLSRHQFGGHCRGRGAKSHFETHSCLCLDLFYFLSFWGTLVSVSGSDAASIFKTSVGFGIDYDWCTLAPYKDCSVTLPQPYYILRWKINVLQWKTFPTAAVATGVNRTIRTFHIRYVPFTTKLAASCGN